MRLILASASPRRAELLTAAGFTFEVHVAGVDEQVRAGELPRHYVRRLAIEKAGRAWEELTDPAVRVRQDFAEARPAGQSLPRPHDDVIVVAADTAVVVDGEILGKPLDDADAGRMLRLIAGRVHTVMTGVGVRSRDVQLDDVAETLVSVNRLSHEEMRWYIASHEGRDKAGAYAIQGLASRFIPRIEGSYSNVVGLPVEVVCRLLVGCAPGGEIPQF
jgi:septum formation protein